MTLNSCKLFQALLGMLPMTPGYVQEGKQLTRHIAYSDSKQANNGTSSDYDVGLDTSLLTLKKVY